MSKYTLKVTQDGVTITGTYEDPAEAAEAFHMAYRRNVEEVTLFSKHGDIVLYFHRRESRAD